MPKPTIASRVAEIRRDAARRGGQALTTWETGFLASIESRDELSPDQESALKRIERKVYDEREDDADDEDTLGSVDRRWDRHHERR